ncbi:hypothetical protein KFV09_14590 [Anoxybacillus rupiensis]|uniref:hypothetical protein n=1 Tax=Anoxybacteroides rupiense TaxID=311460 RepID=UPI001BA8F4E1|nr:hypothetical protein [Anoxybacillus rupiensis]MBS2772755.1 hypothetical protein [Anoxybacillus rupiensis]
MENQREWMQLREQLQEKDKKIETLIIENHWLKKDLAALKSELESEKKRLREAVGAWRRKAQGGGGQRKCLREGYHAYHRSHYKVYVVTDIPKDLDIEEVCVVLNETFLPSVAPYRFVRCDYSTKYKGWLVEVSKGKYIDIYEPPTSAMG